MAEEDIELDDTDIPQKAVEALNAAHRRAIASGVPVLVVENDELVRVDRGGKTVLKKLTPRRKVSAGVKRIAR